MADDKKDAFIQDYIDRFVMPRMSNRQEAERALAYFKRSSYFHAHRVRFLETYDRIIRNVDFNNRKIAELGSISAISKYFREILGKEVDEIGGDFRYRIEAPDNHYDLVFCLEVFEHIKDHDSSNLDDVALFNFSGAKSFLTEMRRILRPGGQVVLTTPNANSLIVTWRAIHGEQPWLYWPHVKEYTISDVCSLASDAGFDLELIDTMYVFFFLEDRTKLLQEYFAKHGASTENRGDDAFYIFKKSSAP
jgi:SAM-dependent methyltransferase